MAMFAQHYTERLAWDAIKGKLIDYSTYISVQSMFSGSIEMGLQDVLLFFRIHQYFLYFIQFIHDFLIGN